MLASDLICRRNEKGKLIIDWESSNLDQIRKRAQFIISSAMKDTYDYLPIDRRDLLERLLGMINRDSLPLTISKSMLVPKVSKFLIGRVSHAKAQSFGIYDRRVPLRTSCKDFHMDSSFYHGADNCEDVVSAIESGEGLPAGLFISKLKPSQLKDIMSRRETSLKLKSYETPPVECDSNNVWSHTIKVFGPLSMRYILRHIDGENYNAWALGGICKSIGQGTDLLMFNAGMYVYVPIDVEIDGQVESYTIVLGSAAAAPLSDLLKRVVPTKVAAERFYGQLRGMQLLFHAFGG